MENNNKNNIYILDDIYGKKIYSELKGLTNKYNYPIKSNIFDPLKYIDKIINEEPLYVLLDHWFINEETLIEYPLGLKLLNILNDKLEYTEEITYKKYLFFNYKKIVTKKRKLKTIFISISDEGEKLKTRDIYKEYINYYTTTKKGEDILNIIKTIENNNLY